MCLWGSWCLGWLWEQRLIFTKHYCAQTAFTSGWVPIFLSFSHTHPTHQYLQRYGSLPCPPAFLGLGGVCEDQGVRVALCLARGYWDQPGSQCLWVYMAQGHGEWEGHLLSGPSHLLSPWASLAARGPLLGERRHGGLRLPLRVWVDTVCGGEEGEGGGGTISSPFRFGLSAQVSKQTIVACKSSYT